MLKVHSKSTDHGEETIVVLSVIYGLFVVVLAVVFKVSENITAPQSRTLDNLSNTYLCILYSIGVLWLVAFKIHNVWRKRKTQQFVKSPHASNRWMKAIIAIFGFSVLVKESLGLIAITQIHNDQCHNKTLYVITFIFYALFVLGQVVFLFFYSKIHIQELTGTSRFGVMHVMATNLSVWICVIADETNHALDYEKYHHHHSSIDSAIKRIEETKFALEKEAQQSSCNVSNALAGVFHNASSNAMSLLEGVFSGACFCHNSVCTLVSRANQFLNPMLIEFCLVASCLMYVTWNNVGKSMKCHPIISKPSYKFYKSYKGVAMGTFVLLGCVIVMTLLASMESSVPSDEKSYITEYKLLAIHDGYLAFCNCLTLLACIAGFYVFAISSIPRRKHFRADLDVVLLFICLIGPLLVSVFAILSLSTGPPDTKRARWGVSLARAITDIIVSILQIFLIMHGFSKEPAVHPLTDPKKLPHLDSREKSPFTSINDINGDVEMAESTFTERDDETKFDKDHMVEVERLEEDEENISSTNSVSNRNPPLISITSWEDGQQEQNSTILAVPQMTRKFRNSRTMNPFQHPPAPRRSRIILRDIFMFLVVSNTCLWVLFSLNGTAFKVYTYQKEYYGHSVWTTISSVTAPLSIFLKLHSAACFFEIWSYT